jgi:hypothetical protein
MPFLSSPKHRELYAPSPTVTQQLADIRTVLEAVRQLQIAAKLKRDMLDVAIWQVAFATGNTQSRFMGRYRSEAVITQVGLKIQRDHAYPRAALLAELLGASPDLESIIERAQCCCVVTEEEHKRLSAVHTDGWARYKHAGIVVYDMLHGRRLDPDPADPPPGLSG